MLSQHVRRHVTKYSKNTNKVPIRSFRSIHNKDTILPTIATMIGQQNQTCVEYIFTKPYWYSLFSFFGFNRGVSATNPYGHSGIRYSYKDPGTGTIVDTVMNVSGQKGTRLVNFIDSSQYLFTDDSVAGNEQGGVFNRSFISVRISGIDTEKIQQMEQYFRGLDKKQTEGTVGYGMLLHIFTNPIRRFLGLTIKGNCSFWTSNGLIEAGIIERGSSWPLSLWFKVLFRQMEQNKGNVNIIAYRSIKYDREPAGSLIHPLFPFTSIFRFRFSNPYKIYWNLDSFADVILTPHSDRHSTDTVYQPFITTHDHIVGRWDRLKKEFKKIVRLK